MARLLMNTTRSNPNGTHKMSERIKELVERYNMEIDPCYPDANRETLMRFAQDIVNQCIDLVNERCEDLANGDVLRDPVLWESVTREYGADKKRHFDPVGIAVDLASVLKQNFGVE